MRVDTEYIMGMGLIGKWIKIPNRPKYGKIIAVEIAHDFASTDKWWEFTLEDKDKMVMMMEEDFEIFYENPKPEPEPKQTNQTHNLPTSQKRTLDSPSERPNQPNPSGKEETC